MAVLPAIATSFVRKLYRILDQESAAIIAWDTDGMSFVILDSAALDSDVLPRYFRGRLDNFYQQLREHNFTKDETEGKRERYCHQFFRRGFPDKLNKILHSPLPRKRPPRKKKRKQDQTTVVALDVKMVKSSATTSVHHTKVESEFKHAVIDDPAALAANPLFAADNSSLTGFARGLALDNLEPFTVPIEGLLPGKDTALSNDVMETLLTLLNTSLSTDAAVASANATANSSSSKNLFAEGRPPVILPPIPPGIIENGQFSDETLNNLMRWVSANGTSAS